MRNVVHVLGKIGDEAAFSPWSALLGHPSHAGADRGLRARCALVARPGRAADPRDCADATPTRRFGWRRSDALGALRRDEALPVLRDVAVGAAAARADLPLREEAVEALAAHRDAPGACEALEALARRRVWPWQRAERRLRETAAAALAARARTTRIRAMSDAAAPDPQLIFTYLHGMLRAPRSLPADPSPDASGQADALPGADGSILAGHGRLTYRFMGDLLVANDRILPRESLLYRRFLETCQQERGLGAIAFTERPPGYARSTPSSRR